MPKEQNGACTGRNKLPVLRMQNPEIGSFLIWKVRIATLQAENMGMTVRKSYTVNTALENIRFTNENKWNFEKST
jgi:hypothetical protein